MFTDAAAILNTLNVANHLQAGSNTYQVSNPPAYEIITEPTGRQPASRNQIHYFVPGTNTRGHTGPKPIIQRPPQEASYVKAPSKKPIREGVDRAKWEADTILPSIESPRAPRRSDHRFSRGNDHAIVVDSSPTDKQAYRELRSVPGPGEHPEHFNPKRRRLQSPSGRYNTSRNVVIEPVTSDHRISGAAPPTSMATGEIRDRGKIVYLPVRENGMSSSFSQSTNSIPLQNALQGNAPSRQHNLPANVSRHVQGVVDSHPGYFGEENTRPRNVLKGSLYHSVAASETDAAKGPQWVAPRAHDDLSRKQIYMMEQPIAADAPADNPFKAYRPRMSPSSLSRLIQAQKPIHSNGVLQRGDAHFGQSIGDRSRVPMEQVPNRHPQPREAPADRNRQQYVDDAPYLYARQSNISSLHDAEGYHNYHLPSRASPEYISTDPQGAYVRNR